MNRFEIPSDVENLITVIESAGYEAWLCGGCVRDMLRGDDPHDYDVASSAPCEAVEKLFDRVIGTGIKHGTVTVVLDRNIEVTRYRVDGGYTDRRRPDKVDFTSDFREDLARRDFTVNAMGWHPRRGLFDPFGGQRDLSDGIIRAVGDPRRRFDEDALRILRAVRFASTLGFILDSEVKKAVSEMSELLKNISAERIFYELWRTLGGKKPSLLSLIIDSGGLKHIGLGGESTAPDSRLTLLDRLPCDEFVRMAALCRLCGADAGKVLCALKSDRARRRTVTALSEEISSAVPVGAYETKRLLGRIDPEHCSALTEAQAILNGGNAEAAKKELLRILSAGEAYSIPALDICGDDLTALGADGKTVGEILSVLLEMVISDTLPNRHDRLTAAAKTLLKKKSGRKDG